MNQETGPQRRLQMEHMTQGRREARDIPYEDALILCLHIWLMLVLDSDADVLSGFVQSHCYCKETTSGTKRRRRRWECLDSILALLGIMHLTTR